MAGGSLASGNNPGGLKVHGDLVFRPGSRFDARVAPSGVGGSVGVTGRALLNGDVMALAQAGDWQASTRYTLLRAEGGFDGTRFASVATNMPFLRSEEHTSELPSLMRISYAVFCLQKKKQTSKLIL